MSIHPVNEFQYEQVITALNEQTRTLYQIRDSLNAAFRPDTRADVVNVPKVNVPMRAEKPARPAEAVAAALKESELAQVRREALTVVLDVLDGWIEGKWSNHHALEHRAEPVGSECWQRFSPADFRVMVNDAARQLGMRNLPARKPIEKDRRHVS